MTLFTIHKEIVKPEVGTEPDIRPQAERLLMSKKVKEKDEKQIQGNNCVKENTSAVDDQITHLKDNRDFPSCESLNLTPDLAYHKFQIEKDNIITEPIDLPYHKLQIEKDNRITEPSHHNSDAQEQLTHSMVSTLKERPVMDAIVQTKGQPYFSDCHVKEPVLLPEFVGLILCFRLPKFIATDLESAFLMVGLHQTDRKFTKFQRVKDHFNLPLIEKTKVSHTVLPEKLFPKQILDERAHGAKKKLENPKERNQENLAGYGIALILISLLTFIINVSCDHKDQIVVCRKEQTIKRNKIPNIALKAFNPMNQILINKIFLPSNFIYITSIITIIISFKSTLAFFIYNILFNFLRSGEGVRDPNHKVSPDPTRIFQKICLHKVIGDRPPEGDILLLKSEQSLVLFQSYVKRLGKSPKEIFELQKKERQQFGRISTPFIKSEMKTPKWLGGRILPEDVLSLVALTIPLQLFQHKYLLF
uniref:Uncharacterized protein n=1 Tax=Meloidogyne enterolobii TaxID=390850 RepID=A0A6V7X799_MELEN|nr:unnamed protein product [Meloidogyne enterolobii]